MLYKFLYLFLYFLIYSFIGWLIEVTVVYANKRKLVNRGFLFGPYCPIFGFGALILLLIFSNYKDDPLTLFVMFAFYATILEYFTSYILEKLFNARWWDYSHLKFNLNGRICLTNSILFGIIGLIFGYLLNSVIMNLLDSILSTIFYIISITVLVLFIIDIFITLNIVSKLKKNIVLLSKDMTEDIKRQIMAFIEKNHFFKAFPLLNKKLKAIKLIK